MKSHWRFLDAYIFREMDNALSQQLLRELVYFGCLLFGVKLVITSHDFVCIAKLLLKFVTNESIYFHICPQVKIMALLRNLAIKRCIYFTIFVYYDCNDNIS